MHESFTKGVKSPKFAVSRGGYLGLMTRENENKRTSLSSKAGDIGGSSVSGVR